MLDGSFIVWQIYIQLELKWQSGTFLHEDWFKWHQMLAVKMGELFLFISQISPPYWAVPQLSGFSSAIYFVEIQTGIFTSKCTVYIHLADCNLSFLLFVNKSFSR